MPIKAFKASRGEVVERRALTISELQTIYAKAPNDFWRYMIFQVDSTPACAWATW